MKLPASSCVRVVALTLLIGNAGSFSVLPKNTRTSSLGSLHVRNLSKDDIQCSCAVEPVVSGKPSPIALARNPREAIQSGAIFSVDGERKTMDDIIGLPSDDSGVSVVVFLRSLG
jgi:hypothetical protein